MKPPVLLKSILDLCFICFLIIYIPSLLVGAFVIITGSGLPIEISGITVEELTPTAIIFLIGSLLTSGVFVYVVFLLRKLVRSFFKSKSFTRLQISLFRLIGQLIILNSIAEFLLNFLSNIFLEDKPRLVLEFETSYDGFLFKLSIGLFLIYLGRLFDNAKMLREENELTV